MKPNNEAVLRRVVHELRTYNPAADNYKGAHIHSGWADTIEKVLAATATVAKDGGEVCPHEVPYRFHCDDCDGAPMFSAATPKPEASGEQPAGDGCLLTAHQVDLAKEYAKGYKAGVWDSLKPSQPERVCRYMPEQMTDEMRDAANVIVLDRGKLVQIYRALRGAAPISEDTGKKVGTIGHTRVPGMSPPVPGEPT